MDSILVVEDRQGLRNLYTEFLKTIGYQVKGVATAEEALEALAGHTFSMILSDYMLPGMNGMELLEKLKESEVESPVLLITAFGEVKLAVSAMKAGAADFLEKPVDLEHLKLVVTRIIDHHRLIKKEDFAEVKREEKSIIGQAPALCRAVALADQVAATMSNVLLLGESGVGKELFARRIHQQSNRKKGQFLALNCAALPAELMESELFGHEKGAFTGAFGKKQGLLEIADGGTLFLDEIGEMPIHLQPKLLRAVQEKSFRRVGGHRNILSDFRLVCATNRDLQEGVREGWFREDLFYRLAGFPVQIPPLREREEDIPTLCSYFLKEAGHPHPELDESTMNILKDYDWPGNIRELINVLERARILSKGNPIKAEHLPQDLKRSDHFQLSFPLNLNKTMKENKDELEAALEKALIRAALEKHNSKRERTARALGISVKTLFNKIQQYKL